MVGFLGPIIPPIRNRSVLAEKNFDGLSIISAYITFMNDLLTTGLLVKAKQEHEVRAQLRACEAFVEHNGRVRAVFAEDLLKPVARAILDGRRLAGATRGSRDALTLGNDLGLGDGAKKRAFEGDLPKTDSYHHAMVEIALAAWYLEQGYDVKSAQNAVEPDLILTNVHTAAKIYIECKHSAPRRNRIVKELRTASRKLRQYAPHYRIAFIHLDLPLSRNENPGKMLGEIAHYAQEIRRELGIGKHTGLDLVSLSWDEYVFAKLGHDWTFHVRRCVENIARRASPNRSIIYGGENISIGLTQEAD